MNSQLYTAASGLLVQERRLELISNNLANLSTAGYRAQHAFSAVFDRFGPDAPEQVRMANAGVALAGTWETPGAGSRTHTGRPLDLALEPDEYLVLETGGGRRYSRAGSLLVSREGTLTDESGNRVLNSEKKPFAGLSAAARVEGDGRILDGDQELGRLLVVRDPGGDLLPEGRNLMTAAPGSPAPEEVNDPVVTPGFRERSNTDPLIELVDLIEAQRTFESYQKLITMTMSEVNRKAVNELVG